MDMVEWINSLMSGFGYWGIGLLMFAENLFPPIPSELIMPLAGFTVAQGKMNFGLAILLVQSVQWRELMFGIISDD